MTVTANVPAAGADPLVDHPKHYNTHPSAIEVIELVRGLGFDLGSAVKYVARAGQKGDAIQDLEKAIWYLEDAKRDDHFVRPRIETDSTIGYKWDEFVAYEPDETRRKFYLAARRGDLGTCIQLIQMMIRELKL